MAGRIPQSFINDLLARIDIVDVIDQRVPLKKAGKNYQARCPFHEEKTPSFSVSPDKQFYYCFGCQASGTALTFLLEYERLDFVEAVETLARSVGMEVPREAGRREPTKSYEDLYELLRGAEKFYRDQLRSHPPAIDYLKGRGITGITARDFGLGFAPEGWQNISAAIEGASAAKLLEAGLLTKNDRGRMYDRFRDRLMFPIRDLRGRVIGFGGRVMGDGGGPKYLNSPETPVFKKGEELYGLYEARSRNRSLPRVLVVEGYMDVIALAQSGIAYAVATLGTSVSQSHFKKIFRYAEQVVCCFDGDTAGRQAAWRALEVALPELSEGRQLRFVFLPEGDDPDSLVMREGAQGFEAQMNQATPALDYLFNTLAAGLDLASLDDRARFAGLVSPYIDQVQPGLLRDFMIRRLDEMTGGLAGAQVTQGAPKAAPRAQQPTPQTPQSAPLPKAARQLSERLLSTIVRHTGAKELVDADAQETLTNLAGQELFTRVVQFLKADNNRGVDEVFAYFADEPDAASVLDRLLRQQRAVAVSTEQEYAEFAEGVARLCVQLRRVAEKSLLSQLRDDPSQENFVRYVSRKHGNDSAES